MKPAETDFPFINCSFRLTLGLTAIDYGNICQQTYYRKVTYWMKEPISVDKTGVSMKVTLLKIVFSVFLVVSGVFLGITLTKDTSDTGQGTITLDFGNYDIKSSSAQGGNAAEALNAICDQYDFMITFDGEHNVKTINGYPGVGDSREWGLYTLNGTGWTKYSGAPTDLKITSTSVVSWALCEDGQSPSPAVDASGYSFYGFEKANTIVCLAPSCTETVCALGYEDLIIGTDFYSNYPSSVQYKRTVLHTITDTGTYTTPNYEIIVKLKPDLVIGIASQSSHTKTIEKLRAVGINGIVVFDGEDLESVYNNTYMTGIAMGLSTEAIQLTQRLKEEVEQTYSTTSGLSPSDRPSIMTALSINKSPYVAGNYTYLNDIYSKAGATNSFSDMNGWRQATPEKIPDYNPECIIIMSEVEVLESEYDDIIANLPSEWKSTDAFTNGEIYIVWGSANDMLSRPSTRLAQVTELLARVLHEDLFVDVIHVPKVVGDDYMDYLTYSKEL